MGFNSNDIELIIRLRSEGYVPNRSSIVEIGAQQLSNDLLRAKSRIADICQVFGAEPRDFGDPFCGPASDGGEAPIDAAAPLAREFWEWLGLSYNSIDVDGSPGSIPLDLNYDSVPDDMFGKFALVTNYGTTEH